ncbi:MFS transporter [Pseudomonas putida]|uniref:MFS transporter n=1 Tax=Pseudomonas putida TaxID=303 RepID=UPI003F34DDCE
MMSDGYILGIIGIATNVAAPALKLDALWLGLIGAGSLAGLFIGSLLGGAVVGRIGRRSVFAWDMLLFALLSALQFFVTDALQLLLVRLALGVVLGIDYVVVKTFIAEFVPRKSRGSLMSAFVLSWVLGYVGAYMVGYSVRDLDPDVWRWMLASSVLPALLGLAFRFNVPESPRWLVEMGRSAEARAIIDRHIGTDVQLPQASGVQISVRSPYRELFSKRWRRRTWVGMLFYGCHILPYFCLSTFAPNVMSALKVGNPSVAALIYNSLLLIGAVIGMLIIDRIPRRTMVVGGFIIQAVLLAPLVLLGDLSPWVMVALFGIFGCVLAAHDTLVFAYPAELFPTELRAAGIGLATAASRLAAATSTFFLPMVVAQYSVQVALGICAAVALVGGFVCWLWAPETRGVELTAASLDDARDVEMPLPAANAPNHHRA